MKFLAFALSSIVLPSTGAYLVSPPGTAAHGATAQCSAWVQASYGVTCEIIERVYGMSEDQLISWVSVANSIELFNPPVQCQYGTNICRIQVWRN